MMACLVRWDHRDVAHAADHRRTARLRLRTGPGQPKNLFNASHQIGGGLAVAGFVDHARFLSGVRTTLASAAIVAAAICGVHPPEEGNRMTTWTSDELDRIAAADELRIQARGADGILHAPVPIWVVRHGDEIYVRSYRGAGGAWYRTAQASHEGRIEAGGVTTDVSLVEVGDGVNNAVDAAYRAKYGRCSSYVAPMVAPAARETTLKLVPR